MYGEIQKDIDRLWCITAYGKWGGSTYGRGNGTKNVIAKTAEEAIAKVHEDNPDVKIVGVTHKGQVDYVCSGGE